MVLMRDARTAQHVVGELDKESSANISTARCEIVREFLAHPARPEWLWMIDSDMTFGDGILERLLATAHPVDRPIVGGLCFGVRPLKVDGVERLNACLATELELFPTVYTLDADGRMLHWAGYPQDSVVQVSSTGAACLLVHRSMLADGRWLADGHPLPWFRESVLHGKVCSEDHFFCIKAGSFGFPVHLDTAAKTGHVKSFVADEDLYLSQRAARHAVMSDPATDPTTVIVPVLNRPQNALPFVRSLQASTGLARALAVCSNDVDAEAWRDAGRVCRHPLSVLRINAISFAEKVNAAMYAPRIWFDQQIADGTFDCFDDIPSEPSAGDRLTDPWIFITGDDVRFHPGWLDHAQQTARDTGAQVVGTNDLGNPKVMSGEHAVHMLIARDYIEQVGASWDGPGVVCHEGYRHNFVDNEIVAAAKQRGVWAPSLASVVEHLHPRWGKGEMDETYRKGQYRHEKDQAEFEARLKASLSVVTA